MASVVLLGDKALQARLNELAGPGQKRVVAKATREALRPTLAAAKRNAPRQSGRLAKSVKLRALKRSRSRIGARVTTGDQSGDFSGKGYYGAFVEFGHKRGKRSLGVRRAQALGKRGALRQTAAFFRKQRRRVEKAAKVALAGDKRTVVPANPFMKRAVDSTRGQAKEIFKREFQAEFDKEVAKARSKN